MNTLPIESESPDRPTYATNFHVRMNRYRRHLARWWWMVLAVVIIAVAAQAILIHLAPPKYVSIGRMIVAIKLSIQEGSVYNEELSNFLGTQAALMQSSEVISRAHERAKALKPTALASPVQLAVSVLPKTTIFVLRGTGDNPEYTQAFLQSCMEEYIALKKKMRTQTSDNTVAGLTEEVLRLERELRKCDDEMAAFAGTNSVVLLQEQGNSAGNYLSSLNQKLAGLKFEYELLKALNLDQNLERRDRKVDLLPDDPSATAAAAGRVASDTDYLKAKQGLVMLRAELAEMSEFLRPQHPKMKTLTEDIARRERLLETYRQQGKDDLDNKRTALAVQIEKLQQEIKEWDTKLLEISRKTAEYQRLKANSQRTQALYDRLLATLQTLDVNKEINPESVTIMEKASEGREDLPKLSRKLPIAAILGLIVSLGLVMLIDKLDDRMNSVTELAELFDETVLAQVPREPTASKDSDIALLQPDDARHAFLEAFRSLRSSLLYMSESGSPPRTILVTSSEPNDGKSMTAANLAITMALGGARVLLIDADLRKGVLHERLGSEYKPGLSESLLQGMGWSDVVKPTSVPNLSFIPRGSATQKSGELFLSTAAQRFLKDIASKYDYVVIDSAPVMAADDVTTMAPHMDGVLFVIRAERTSARVARAALEQLTKRRARILGLVMNSVRASASDYYPYYKYKEYYRAYPNT